MNTMNRMVVLVDNEYCECDHACAHRNADYDDVRCG